MIRLLPFVFLFLLGILYAQSVSIKPGMQITPVVAPSIRLEFETIGNLYYQIESSQNLAVWKKEGFAFRGTGGRMAVMVSNHGLPQLYYRVGNNASVADLLPVNPYGGFASLSQSPVVPATLPSLTASGFNPANHRLMVMDSSGGQQTMREISLAELRKLPNMGIQWGDIAGSLANQPDLQTALSGKFSSTNPPNWSLLAGKPSDLLGYGITDAVTTSTVGFMDRFSRYPEGAVLLNNKTRPEIGAPWRYCVTGKNRIGINTISVSAADSSFNDSANGFLTNNFMVGDVFSTWGFANAAVNDKFRFRIATVTAGKITVTTETGNPVTLVNEPAGRTINLEGSTPPYVSGGALRAANNALIYIGGAPTPTSNGKFSITFEVELKPSIYPTATRQATLTIGIKATDIIEERGFLLLDNMIHCQLTGSNIQNNDFFKNAGPIATNQGPHPIAFKAGVFAPTNTKFLMTLSVDGDEMRVSALGGTVVYKDPRLPAYIGNPNTQWFYETGGDSLGNDFKYANVFHLHRVWANAAQLDRTEGWGLPSTNYLIGSTNVYGGTDASNPIIRGSTLQGTVAGTAGNRTPLISVNGQELGKAGDYERATIHGSFPNGNPKILSLHVKGQEVWNSGSLNDTGEWTLQIDRVAQSASTYQLNIRYESETTRRFGYHQATESSGPGFATELRCTSGQNGDVAVRAALTSVSRQ
jgi:hypothetical protein